MRTLVVGDLLLYKALRHLVELFALAHRLLNLKLLVLELRFWLVKHPFFPGLYNPSTKPLELPPPYQI